MLQHCDKSSSLFRQAKDSVMQYDEFIEHVFSRREDLISA